MCECVRYSLSQELYKLKTTLEGAVLEVFSSLYALHVPAVKRQQYLAISF